MASRLIKRYLILMVLSSAGMSLQAQNAMPMGIHYQAVARDSYGQELINKKISVKFSIISGDPLAPPVYQELHQDKTTSKFGVFTLVIGHGVSSLALPCTTLSQIAWDQANHFLKVEVKFENDFMDMGTMQFLAVPYALYAQKSLEPGPEGPKGDRGDKGEPGDPATDNQTLSFDGSNLSISGAISTVNLTPLLQTLQVSNDGTGGYNLSLTRGNSINLATIEKDGDTQNEIQDLSYNNTTHELTLLKSSAPAINLTELKNDADADPVNEIQDLSYNGTTRELTLLKSTAPVINLTELKNDADADPVNEIQALTFSTTDNILSLTNSASADLTSLKNDADADPANEIQTLTFNSSDNRLHLTNSVSADLTPLKNDADADPTNELQTLSYNKINGDLTITSKGSVNLSNTIGFKAKKSTTQTGLTAGVTYPFINSEAEFIEGGCYNISSGNFTAPSAGIYTFYVYYKADGSGSARILTMLKNEVVYEVLGPDISAGTELYKWVIVKLNQGDIIRLTINTGMATYSGSGFFLGYRVN